MEELLNRALYEIQRMKYSFSKRDAWQVNEHEDTFRGEDEKVPDYLMTKEALAKCKLDEAIEKRANTLTTFAQLLAQAHNMYDNENHDYEQGLYNGFKAALGGVENILEPTDIEVDFIPSHALNIIFRAQAWRSYMNRISVKEAIVLAMTERCPHEYAYLMQQRNDER